MDDKNVKAYFESNGVVDDYAKASVELGLWASEVKIFTRLFAPDDSILELGCGAGRIAFGLHELGFHNLLATDYARSMVGKTRDLAKRLDYAIHSRVADATCLEFEDAIFDGAIFGFNGLMQIPKSVQRERALNEVFRVLRPGAWFVFTTHDRDCSTHRDFWEAETLRWEYGTKKPELEDFGDRAEWTDHGIHFMHVPTVSEMQLLLNKVGFHIEVSVMRSELGKESVEVEAFSDDCRFWIVQKPEASAKS
ncbi:MAG: methylase [Puniceicoccaceae bacterium]|nr:methylase [Puniceicoccaceae bacterium]